MSHAIPITDCIIQVMKGNEEGNLALSSPGETLITTLARHFAKGADHTSSDVGARTMSVDSHWILREDSASPLGSSLPGMSA